MPVFDKLRELRTGRNNEIFASTRMTGIHSSETNNILNAHGSNADTESEPRMLTQEEVEQMRTCIAVLTKQLEDLARLIRGILSVHRQKFSPRASTNSIYSGVTPPPDFYCSFSGKKAMDSFATPCRDYRI